MERTKAPTMCHVFAIIHCQGLFGDGDISESDRPTSVEGIVRRDVYVSASSNGKGVPERRSREMADDA